MLLIFVFLSCVCVGLADWTSEPLCILKNVGKCPTGFTAHELTLSLQTDVNPNEKGYDGRNLMRLGFAGDSSLEYSAYDGLYTLALQACCKR
ncbi:hypothetical protein Y032_0024g1076 [Ancylostoma ceylanicum]|uniref:Transthyretin-like family protein n=1 Tax=Ancylostoma ceylanicum TaxID=53326 RepID=A0A016UXB4_9BILA|nr:hypothetical protein Y032_0024g1076 [Ancylostoma ceylanicum]